MDNQNWRTSEAEFRRKLVDASQRFHDADATFIISETTDGMTLDGPLLNKRADAADEMAQILKDWNAAAYEQLRMNGSNNNG